MSYKYTFPNSRTIKALLSRVSEYDGLKPHYLEFGNTYGRREVRSPEDFLEIWYDFVSRVDDADGRKLLIANVHSYIGYLVKSYNPFFYAQIISLYVEPDINVLVTNDEAQVELELPTDEQPIADPLDDIENETEVDVDSSSEQSDESVNVDISLDEINNATVNKLKEIATEYGIDLEGKSKKDDIKLSIVEFFGFSS